MRYETLFDLADYGYRDGRWWLVGAALALLAIALARHQRYRRASGALPRLLVLLGMIGSVGAGGVPLWDHHRLLAEFNAGRALVVEGVVHAHRVHRANVLGMEAAGLHSRDGGERWESFSVGAVSFGFAPDASQVGFRNQLTPPVDLRDGQRLRVHYVEDVPGDATQRRIVRLERAR